MKPIGAGHSSDPDFVSMVAIARQFSDINMCR